MSDQTQHFLQTKAPHSLCELLLPNGQSEHLSSMRQAKMAHQCPAEKKAFPQVTEASRELTVTSATFCLHFLPLSAETQATIPVSPFLSFLSIQILLGTFHLCPNPQEFPNPRSSFWVLSLQSL